jgi:hypothetical protein
MRIYEGSPRQDFEEVLRSIGAYLDDRGMREILVVETDAGFIVQGLVIQGNASAWGESIGFATKETLSLLDDDVGKFMDEALASRGEPPDTVPDHYESALRVIGKYVDEQKPKDIFFFEQDGAYVLRLHEVTPTGDRHQLVEFTADDITEMVANAPALRRDKSDTSPKR